MSTKKKSGNGEWKIVIVEDSPTQAEQLKYILETQGYQVVAASSGKEALALLRADKPNLVISDIVMPEMDGYELCKQIKTDEKLKDIPVILLTALSDPADVIKGLECGADNFLTKPYDERVLFSRIEYLRLNWRLPESKQVQMGVEITFSGQKYFITSDRLQILNLLLSTYESAVGKNRELELAQTELSRLNEQLEQRVKERTAELVKANEELNVEITERKRAEERIEHLNRIIYAIRNVNQLIVREKDPDRLIQDTCANLIETRGFLSAWIALLDKNGELITTAESGLGKDFLTMVERLKRGELTECAKRALAKPDVVVIKDPSATCLDCPLAGNYYGKAGISIRIEHGGKVYGLLTISTPIDLMTEEELSLFKEIAGDISFALHAIEIEKERKLAEEGLRERTYELGERVKELNGLYGISELAETPDISLEEIYQGAANLIPHSWRYSEITCARIIMGNQEFRTNNFRETNWKQTEDIRIEGENNGIVEVFCLEERPESDEGPFLKEERHLISEIAKRLGKITERKRAEEALDRQREQLKSLFDYSGEAITLLDIENHIIDINPAFEKIFGYSIEEARGKIIEDMICPERFYYTESKELDEQSFQGIRGVEIIRRRKDGKEINVRVSAGPLKVSGTITGRFAVFDDITDRKQAEEAMCESEDRLRTIFDTIQAGFVVIDAETHTIVDANPTAVKMIGAPKEKIIGRVCHKYICPAEKGQCPITDLGQKVDNSERILLTANGEEVPILKTVIPILLGGKECLLDSFIDITDKKKLEAQFVQAQKMEAIGTLSGGIAHDFNNILGSILGYTELSMLGVPEGSKLKKNLTEVFTAGKRAETLIQQILAFSRKQELEQKPLQLKYIVRESLKMLRSTLPTDIEIQEDIATDVGVVNADPTQMQQVIMNLCTNAGHAMQEDGGVLAVGLANVELDDVAAAQYLDMDPGPYLRVSVSDTGYGITADVKERIFEPFFTTKAPGEGTGLGLSVVHGIVKSHGGTITVYSEPGKGSTFHMYLPLIQEEAIKPEMDEQTPILTGNERILFIDDEQALADLGKQMLERLGYKVTTRTSSIEALELFKAQPDQFDLVITDMTMPKMMGDKLAQELIKIRPDIPIIICTGHSGRISEEKAIGMGIKAFAMKPLVMRNLANMVRKVLDEEKEKPAEGLILVIDDDNQFRGMLRQTLEHAGYEVTDAPNGKEGIRVFRENPADLVITDIIMPEKEGIETIRELKREFPDVKIIAISGGGRIGPVSYLKMAKGLGAQRTLTKPLEREELLRVVRELIGQ